MAQSNESISALISLLGFENKTHFYKLFHKKHGLTPMEYRRQHTDKV